MAGHALSRTVPFTPRDQTDERLPYGRAPPIQPVSHYYRDALMDVTTDGETDGGTTDVELGTQLSDIDRGLSSGGEYSWTAEDDHDAIDDVLRAISSAPESPTSFHPDKFGGAAQKAKFLEGETEMSVDVNHHYPLDTKYNFEPMAPIQSAVQSSGQFPLQRKRRLVPDDSMDVEADDEGESVSRPVKRLKMKARRGLGPSQSILSLSSGMDGLQTRELLVGQGMIVDPSYASFALESIQEAQETVDEIMDDPCTRYDVALLAARDAHLADHAKSPGVIYGSINSINERIAAYKATAMFATTVSYSALHKRHCQDVPLDQVRLKRCRRNREARWDPNHHAFHHERRPKHQDALWDPYLHIVYRYVPPPSAPPTPVHRSYYPTYKSGLHRTSPTSLRPTRFNPTYRRVGSVRPTGKILVADTLLRICAQRERRDCLKEHNLEADRATEEWQLRRAQSEAIDDSIVESLVQDDDDSVELALASSGSPVKSTAVIEDRSRRGQSESQREHARLAADAADRRRRNETRTAQLFLRAEAAQMEVESSDLQLQPVSTANIHLLSPIHLRGPSTYALSESSEDLSDIASESMPSRSTSPAQSTISEPPEYEFPDYPTRLPVTLHPRPVRIPSPPQYNPSMIRQYDRQSPPPPPPYNAETDCLTLIASSPVAAHSAAEEDHDSDTLDEDEEELEATLTLTDSPSRDMIGSFPGFSGHSLVPIHSLEPTIIAPRPVRYHTMADTAAIDRALGLDGDEEDETALAAALEAHLEAEAEAELIQPTTQTSIIGGLTSLVGRWFRRG